MLLYNLVKRSGQPRCADHRRRTQTGLPPEFLDTIDIDYPLDIIHPSLTCRPAGCCWMWSLGECRHRGLWQIATFGRRRIEPQRPCGIERMLARDGANRKSAATGIKQITEGKQTVLPPEQGKNEGGRVP
jgi:hypothetical protein